MGARDSEVGGAEQEHGHAQPAKPLPQALQASLADGKPEDIAAFLREHPQQRDRVIRSLHEQRGNAFVGQVLAIARPAPAATARHDHDHDDGAFESDDSSATTGAASGPTGARFGKDEKLGDVERGTAELKPGDFSPSVRKVQQALRELGYKTNVTGSFDARTETCVQEFQKTEKLARTDGVVDSETFIHIEQSFSSLKQYADTAQNEAPGLKDTPKHGDADNPPTALMRDTHKLDAAEKAEAAQAITVADVEDDTEKKDKKKPFKKASAYKKKVTTKLQERIDFWYANALEEKAAHDTGQTFEMSQMLDIGNAAKESVDKVFGSYAAGPKIDSGNLKDRFEADRLEQSTWKAERKHGSALSRAAYFMNIDPAFVKIDEEHNANRTRDKEQGIIDDVLEKIATKNEEKLLLISASWAASTNRQGIMKIQRVKTGDDATDRAMLWTKFGSMIHEYCHSLVHPRWHEFRDQKGEKDPQGEHTLAEGVTEFLTRVALSKVNLQDDALQSRVEGTLHDGLNPKADPDRAGHYDEAYQRAEALVGTVGIYNLYAAYFLGQTHLIGA